MLRLLQGARAQTSVQVQTTRIQTLSCTHTQVRTHTTRTHPSKAHVQARSYVTDKPTGKDAEKKGGLFERAYDRFFKQTVPVAESPAPKVATPLEGTKTSAESAHVHTPKPKPDTKPDTNTSQVRADQNKHTKAQAQRERETRAAEKASRLRRSQKVGYNGLEKVNHRAKKKTILKVKGLPRPENSPEPPATVDEAQLNIAKPGLIRHRPLTPARRGMITLDKSGLSKDGPFRPLTYGQAASGGRSSQTGRITVRHRQGRAQRTLVRTVDFIRSARLDIPATIVRVEHDPSRTGLLALVKYAKEKPVSTTVRADGTDMDGLPPGFWGHLYDPDELVDDVLNDVTQKLTSEEEETPEDLTDSVDPEAEAVDETPATAVIAKGRAAIAIGRAKSEAKMYKDYAYILCPQGVAPGMKLVSSRSTSVPVLPGNACLIKYMRAGSVIHNVELKPGRGGQLIRSAGSWGTILGKDEEKGFAVVRITSKTQMRVRLDCMATYGKVSNPEHHNEAIGSAGRNRRLGRRPKVRGIAMNPCDHPHGGKGTGKVNDMTRWGKRGKGWKTVRNLKRKKGGIHGNIIWRHIANKKQAGQVKQ